MSATAKTYQQNLTKGLESSLASQLIENGKLRFTKDTGRLYVDIVEGALSKRIKISELINDKTDAEIQSMLSPVVGKIYLASDTHRAYTFNGMGMVDLGSVRLNEATSSNTDRPLWFSEEAVNAPLYDTDITYNTSTGELKTPNIRVTESVSVNGMNITDTVQTIDNQEVHTVRFSFS
jgi:hypothetical protein